MIDTVFNVAFTAFAGGLALWWTVTYGLLSHWRTEQNERVKAGLGTVQDWLKNQGLSQDDASQLSAKVQSSGIKVCADPDTVADIRVFQAQTISPGICAGALLLVCFLIEYAISIKLFDKASAHQVALWVSGLAGILEPV